MSDRTKAYIDIQALNHNLNNVKKISPRSRVLAMVKSNAYGHGLAAIGKILTGADGFGVACLDEALKLREEGVLAPIVIMSGVYTESDLHQAVKHNFHIVIHDYFQIELLKKIELQKSLTVWLKLDSGMHRLGFSPEDFLKAFHYLVTSNKVNQPIVVMTHLADADDIQKKTTEQQLDLFNQYTHNLVCQKSIANSAGIIAWPSSIAHWNRPGIMLYGISPMLNKVGRDHELLPVMTLVSKIAAIHDFKRGDSIGYGGSFTCPEDMRVGVVAIGYGDGYPRHAKNGTPTLIKNTICPLIGRVSMDLITVDLRPCQDAKIGDDVVLWGNDLPAEIVAKYADTIAYELICNVSQRVVFMYR